MSTKLSKLAAKRKELECELDRVNYEMRKEAELVERWVSADEARRLLALFSDPWGKAELDKYENVTRTLVELRPEPTGFIGKGNDGVLTWRSEDLEAWYVKLDQWNGSISVIYPAEGSLFEFNDESAEELGRFLLGAASYAKKEWE